MSYRILHLSDTHATASGLDETGVDALAALDGVLHACRHLPDLDLVVVTGDIADDGSAEGCRAVAERVGRFAADRGVPHVYTTGNHDRRAEFAAVLGTGHRNAAGDDVGVLLEGLDDERAATSMVGGLRVVTLDSLVPGEWYGHLTRAQLEGLQALLRRPAGDGTILALHHPPLHTPTAPWLKSFGLRNPEDLAEVIEATDVGAVLCGHFHLQLSGRMGQATVWSTPGVVTRIDLTAPAHTVRAVHGASASVVDLGGPYSPSFHVLHARDPAGGREVYVVDPTTWEPTSED